MTTEDLLKRLVENALDFLVHSVEEIEAQPKYSVVHFHAATELFLKARLLAEHWSLVVTNRQTPDWDKFVAGDFISVSMEEAASKLDKAVKSGLTADELKVFKEVTRHRNRTVHFFHDAHTSTENDALVQAVARKQLTAWYFLHRLIVGKWKAVFTPWAEEIHKADQRLRDLHAFLKIIFQQAVPDIEKRMAGGSTFEDCPSCLFLAQEHSPDASQPYQTRCLVCELEERYVAVECPECDGSLKITGEGFATCPHCEMSLEPKDVADYLFDSRLAARDIHGDDFSMPVNCGGGCDGRETVVPTTIRIDTDVYAYFCCNCFELFPAVSQCDNCGELGTGDMDMSYLSGCAACYGRGG